MQNATATYLFQNRLAQPQTPAACYFNVQHSLQAIPPLAANKPHPKIKVTLENSSLWRIFNKIGTEMIITKSGRRMFPVVKFRVTGLDPDREYSVMLDMMPMDTCRHKFHQSKWVISGKAEPRMPGRVYFHPDSPSTGRTWLATQSISFHRIKLTNNNLDRNGHVRTIFVFQNSKFNISLVR